jgi:mannosyltransferase OCH1-like enzyme
MFTFETADQKEVRRFRIAQFNGRAATARANGSAVTGMVRSIVENKAQHPPMWTITLIPSPPKAETLRRAPRHRVFAEDAY